jgi:hypothetical protein
VYMVGVMYLPIVIIAWWKSDCDEKVLENSIC